MAIYRETLPIWRRRLPIFAGIALLLVAVIAVILVANPGQAPAPKALEARDLIHQKMVDISGDLDIFDVEYAKVQSGTDKSLTGAPQALLQAQNDYNLIENDLMALDATHAKAVRTGLDTLTAILNAKLPDGNRAVIEVVHIRQHLSALSDLLNQTK
jgi:hypothetical protein